MTFSTRLPRLIGLGIVLIAVTLASATTARSQVTLDVALLDFGPCQIGDTILRTFVVTNIGAVGATVTLTEPDAPFFILESQGSLDIGILEAQSITVGYAATAGSNTSPLDTSEITVNFTTNGIAPISGSVTLGLRGTCVDNGGGASPNDSIIFSGEAIAFGSVTVGPPATRTLRIDNTSSVAATITVGALEAPFSVGSGGGTFTLAPGGSRTVRIDLNAGATGTFGAMLPILYRAGANANDTAFIAVSATVVNGGPQIGVQPGSIEFSGVTNGEIETRTIVISNTAPAGMMTGTVGGVDMPFTIISGGGPFALDAGASLAVEVAFSPANAGLFRDSLIIDYTPPAGAPAVHIVPLTGIAVGGGTGGGDILIATTGTIDFGSVVENTAVVRTILLTNTDTTNTVQVGGLIGGAASASFEIIAGAGPFILAPGASQPISVRFMPTAQGSFTDSIMVDYGTIIGGAPDDTGSFVIRLSGEGTASGSGSLTFSDDMIDFNDGDTVLVGTSVEETVRITNDGATPVTISLLAPDAPFAIVAGGDGTTLQPGASRDVTIRFQPLAGGTFNGLVRFVYGPSDDLNTRDIILRGIAATSTTGVNASGDARGMMLGASVPNPVAGRALIAYTIDRSGPVTIALYNALGERIVTLVDGIETEGEHTVDVDASHLEGGVYYYTMTTAGGTLTRMMTVVR